MSERTRVARPHTSSPGTTTAADRRKEVRHPTQDAVQVSLAPSYRTPFPATVIDVSRSGLRLELAFFLARNARIQILMLCVLSASLRQPRSSTTGGKLCDPI